MFKPSSVLRVRSTEPHREENDFHRVLGSDYKEEKSPGWIPDITLDKVLDFPPN